ncbi:ring finger domain protein [Lentinula edodes]|uniref:Ring finger domain protein n=1 Tax=Lentinula edodes TaxID=5353 RepID=A0A1Q3ELF8_LENED|nr:ring finger domain protein [Lentinula edodes]
MKNDTMILLQIVENGSSLFFRIGDTIFQAMGMSFLATSAVGLATFTAVSVFTVGTGYGAIAVREYFGPGLFDLLLTDEPTNWPAGHFIFLFLTPLRLVSPVMNLGTFTPFFFLWPSIPPYSVREQLTAESSRLDGIFPITPSTDQKWPPGLKTFGFIVVGTSMLYHRVFARFSEFRRQEGPDGAEQEAVLQVQREAPEEPDTPFANLNGVTQYPNISIMIGLLKPFIASGMGHLLYLGAQHSSTLRLVLGIRRFGDITPLYTSPKLVPELSDNIWYWKYYTATAVHEMDPVWIRNSIGLGIFIVMKDCLHLFHLWLTKRELASRRLKNRDFAGVDLNELDLIHPVSNSISS